MRTTLLGLAAIAFFAIHAAVQLHAGRVENLLWACHVADLCVGLGLVAKRPAVVAAGVLMLAIGVPLWLVNLAYGGAFYPTSILTHVGGLTVGIVGLRSLGLPKGSWLMAVVLVAVLLVASRAATPVQANVNLAFAPWKGSSSWAAVPEVYVISLLALWAMLLRGAQSGIEWLAFRQRSNRLAS